MTETVQTWAQPFPGSDAECFIQWKGTDLCIDVHCACGEATHFDGDFAYNLRCGACGAVYEMGTQVKMRRLSDAEVAEQERRAAGAIKVTEHDTAGIPEGYYVREDPDYGETLTRLPGAKPADGLP